MNYRLREDLILIAASAAAVAILFFLIAWPGPTLGALVVLAVSLTLYKG